MTPVKLISQDTGAQRTFHRFANVYIDALIAAGSYTLLDPSRCYRAGCENKTIPNVVHWAVKSRASARALTKSWCPTHDFHIPTVHRNAVQKELFTRSVNLEVLINKFCFSTQGRLKSGDGS